MRYAITHDGLEVRDTSHPVSNLGGWTIYALVATCPTPVAAAIVCGALNRDAERAALAQADGDSATGARRS